MNVPARNASCPCGSGKKYKLCCMSMEAPSLANERAGTAQESWQAAVTAFGNGDFAGAEQACLRIPLASPVSAHALNLRSVVAHMQGRFDEALRLCRQAVAADHTVPEFHNNLGNALQGSGNRAEAQLSFEIAIRLRPTFAEAHNNLGNILLEQGRPTEAIPAYETALRLRSAYAEAHNNLGSALLRTGQPAEALSHFQEAAALRPEYGEAHGNLGDAYLALGRHEEAVGACLEAIRLIPHGFEYYCSLGDAYQALGLSAEAVVAFEETIHLSPEHVHALNNLGNALHALGRNTEAAAAYERARALEPQRAEMHGNLGRLYLLMGREEDARASYARAVECDAHYLPGAEGLFQITRMHCAWENLEEVTAHCLALYREVLAENSPVGSSPFNAFAVPLPPLEQRALVERVGAGIAAPLQALRDELPPRPPRPPGRRLRIGYLSADYRSHATAQLLGHLFARHDRARFEAIAYSTGPNDQSAYRARIENEAERFVDMYQWIPVLAASQIRVDGVDILVDLHGHTTGSSLGVLALRPAPVQVHFLGYPGTVGKDFVDYSLVDAVVCPPEHERYYSERVYRLPDTYHMNEHEDPAPLQPRAAYGLPDEGFVFCCFNAAYKLTPAIFQAWTRILERTSGSVLWLYGINEIVIRNLRAEANRLGLPQKRLIFGSPMPKDQHLARLQHADLMLDTPVVNAMTTASDALWAGVPVLSILGESFPDRAGASLLTAIGLPELIMPNLAAYEETAVRLTCQPEELAALKARLAANRLTYPLFDTARFVRNLEAAYEELWARHQVEAGAEKILALV